jgi:hypothetical protein
MNNLMKPLATAALIAMLAVYATGHASVDKPSADDSDTVIIKVIKHKGDPKTAPATPTPPGDTSVHVTSCESGARTVDTMSESKGADGTITKSRVILCAKGDKGPQDLAQRLSKARQKIADGTELDAAIKAKVLAALDQQIASAKAR